MSSTYSSSNWTVENIYQMASVINFEPEYQRQRVWTRRHNEYLIDSILRGYAIPSIYLNQKLVDGIHQYDMMDGRQRIQATIDFLNNKFKTNSVSADAMENELDDDLGGLYFKELPLRAQIQIKTYHFHVRIFTDIDDASDMFSRINNGVALNPAELRHAMTRSQLRNIVCETVVANPFFQSLPVKNARYTYETIAAQVFVLCEQRGFTDLHSGKLKSAYERYIHISPSKQTMKLFRRVLDSFEIMRTGCNELQWNKNTAIVLANVILLLDEMYLLDYNALTDVASLYFSTMKRALVEKSLPVDQQNPELLLFSMGHGMAGVTYQQKRTMVFLNIMFKSITLTPKPQRDTRRAFTKYQREVALYNAGYKCECCGDKVTMSTFEAHHIIPHSKGGLTTLDNLQVLCKRCHLETHHPQIELGV